jgi:hypothetical protein
MKSIRMLIIGIVIGLIISVPVGAVVQYTLKESDCKIVVDGEMFQDEKLPVLLMEPGYNYLPAATFREICNDIGIDFMFDSETKEIRLTTPQNIKTLSSLPQEQEENIVGEQITQTPDGIEIREIKNNVQYLTFGQIRIQARKTGYDFIFDTETERWKITKDNIVILDAVPITMNYGHGSVEVEYYINNIMPIIK